MFLNLTQRSKKKKRSITKSNISSFFPYAVTSSFPKLETQSREEKSKYKKEIHLFDISFTDKFMK